MKKLIAIITLVFAGAALAEARDVSNADVPRVRSTPTVNWTPSRSAARIEGASLVKSARQHEWLNATPEQRIQIAEELGEAGAKAYAKQGKMEILLEGSQKTIPQGPDMVCRTAKGEVLVIEAKGGSGQPSVAYGYRQGSAEWTVKSAERLLKSSKATQAERDAAIEVLRAAKEGKLRVEVVRTPHTLGEPGLPKVESRAVSSAEARKLASEALEGFEAGILKEGKAISRVLPKVAKGAVAVGFVVDVGVRSHQAAQVENAYKAGSITQQERVRAHSRNATGMAGGWTGAAVGAKCGAGGGAAVGTFICPGPGTAIGTAVGGIGGGIVGYIAGEKCGEAISDKAIDLWEGRQ